jgi:hypothetical protein
MMAKRYVVKALPSRFPYVFGILDCKLDRFIRESYTNRFLCEEQRDREFTHIEAAEFFADDLNAQEDDD